MKKVLLVLSVLCAIFLFACGSTSNSGLKKITIAATPVPHAEILSNVVDDMKEKGYELIVKEFTDYVQPNLAVEQGECEANFFQHFPYLDDFNKERGTHLISVGSIHYEPFGIYKGKSDSLQLKNGAKVAVPNDVTNEARALLLLQSAGLIKLKEGVGLTATVQDIVDNPSRLEITELEAAQIPRSLDSVDVALMNGNYALEAGFYPTDALMIEDQNSEAANTYANIIAVHEKNKDEAFVKDLIACLKSEKVKKFIDEKYNKSVIAID